MSKSNRKPVEYPANTMALDEHGVILINAQASALSLTDVLDEHLSQLRAMLALIHGETPSHFSALAEPLQDSYLWAMHRHVQIIQHLVGLLTVAKSEKTKP